MGAVATIEPHTIEFPSHDPRPATAHLPACSAAPAGIQLLAAVTGPTAGGVAASSAAPVCAVQGATEVHAVLLAGGEEEQPVDVAPCQADVARTRAEVGMTHAYPGLAGAATEPGSREPGGADVASGSADLNAAGLVGEVISDSEPE